MSFIETFRLQTINISASGDNNVINIGAGNMPSGWDNSGTYIAIDFISFIPNGNVTVTLYAGSSASGTALTGPLSLVTGQPLTWENAVRNEHGIITVNPNQPFNINLSAPVQVTGMIRYRLVATN